MFAAVFIRGFSLQSILRHEPELKHRPLALIDPQLPKNVLCQVSSEATKLGVVEGLTPAQALARSPDLIIKPRSITQEETATQVLLQTAFAFSPCIELTAPGTCLLDLKGLGLDTETARQSWAQRILHVLESVHLEAAIGVAATPELALLAARTADGINCIHDAGAFVAQLPIQTASPAPEILEVLERWGIRFVGELLALGRDQVAERLGPLVLQLFERVSPDCRRPLQLLSPPVTFSEVKDFEMEIETLEPLLFVLQRFVEQLSRRVEAAHLAIGELHLQLALASGQVHEHRFRIPDPTCRIPVLFRMLQTYLDGMRTESPVVSLRLTARPCRPVSHQFGLFETTLKQPNQFAETLARLTALCGADQVGTPVLEQTHRPDAFRMGTPDFSAAPTELISRSNADGPALRFFRPAVPATIEFREARPALIRSRILNAAAVDVRGPFHSSGDWWDAHRHWDREEWDIQTAEGTLYRIYRSAAGCFVEGVYD
jgi:protein ImuB